MQIPRETLLRIADALTVSATVAINPDTLEFVDFNQDPNAPFVGETGSEIEKELYDADVQKFEEIKKKWSRHILIEAISSRESYRFMEGFVADLEDEAMKEELFDVLDGRRPFANFKYALADIDPALLKAWYNYENERRADWVEAEIERALHFS